MTRQLRQKNQHTSEDLRREKCVIVTGGAGYIGSLLTGELLRQGCHVTVVDDLLFGGESLLGYWHHPNLCFIKGDVCDPEVLYKAFNPKFATANPKSEIRDPQFNAVIHLAAIVGFPACQAVGRQVARRYNVEATQRVFEAAEAGGPNVSSLPLHIAITV